MFHRQYSIYAYTSAENGHDLRVKTEKPFSGLRAHVYATVMRLSTTLDVTSTKTLTPNDAKDHSSSKTAQVNRRVL